MFKKLAQNTTTMNNMSTTATMTTMQYTYSTTPTLIRVTVEKDAVYVSEGTWPSILTVVYRSTADRNFMSAGNCGYIEMVSPERLEEIKIQFAQKSA